MTLVERALARPPEERESYLASACSGNAELFSRVWSYVESEQRMQGFLLEPLYPVEGTEHPFEPGELLDGRFRIVCEVAQGGMGIVYEALDEKLERRIAIKCAKSGFRKRLPPEVRNASEISHPNVCKIFEIHTVHTAQGEIDFITMEFLDGETLSERLQRGPVAREEARTIARQLSAGLSEAHRNKVIHGDLKSNNIILTTAADGSIRAVITDFGLARRPASSLTTAPSGTRGGTPAYMAPELWKGEEASTASDVYALGVILYELASGRKPYAPEAPCEERIERRPSPVRAEWDRILARCLDPEPARRFRDATEVAQALAPPSMKWMWAASAGVVLAMISGVVTYRSAVPVPETMRLAILPFEASAADRPLGDGLIQQTEQRLQRVKDGRNRHFTMIPSDAAVQNKLDQPEKAIKFFGATHVLYGTLRREGNRTLIHAYLAGAGSPIPLKEWQAPLQPNELGEVPVALAGMITGALRLPPLTVAASVNPAAFPDFARGTGLLRRNATDEAIPLLENAVKADPNSPLPYARLAEAQLLKYSTTNDVTWRDKAILSLGDARRRNPDLAEVLLASGMVDRSSGSYETAEVDLLRALDIEPQNGDVWRNLGQVYQSNNRFGDAIHAYQTAIQVQPDYFKNYQALCNGLHNEGRYQEAVGQCTKMISLAPDLWEGYYVRGIAYYAWGRLADAEGDLRAALKLNPKASKAIRLLASVLVDQTRYGDAIPLFRRAIEIGPETEDFYLNFGQTLRWAGRSHEAGQAYQKGQALALAALAKNSRDVVIRAHSAYFWARLGNGKEAESEAVLALQPGPPSLEVGKWVVMTYEALGEHDRALDVIEAVPDDALRRLNRSPDMAELRKNNRYQQVLQSRHIQ
jgi:serine/threonine protein kinase/tetratricopeptide (TPR) repeat protein